MTVHFFTKDDRSVGSSRQRAFLVANLLEKEGVSVKVCTPPIDVISATPWPQKGAKIISAWKNLLAVGPSDVIFLQRAAGNKYFFMGLVFVRAFLNRKIIFDYDDSTYLHSPRKISFILKHVDVVVAGSHALAAWARKYNSHVYLIPTLVDHEKYLVTPEDSQTQDMFTIGWVGNGPAHYHNLRLLVPVLRELSLGSMRFRFRLVGCLHDRRVRELFSNIPGLSFDCIDELAWDDSRAVPRVLHTFSVGVMPLIDSEWNRGKCAFKAIEYMAAGVPAIVSPVGENAILITDRVNGLTAPNTKEWVSKLVELYDDLELREKLSVDGAKHVREHYSFDAYRKVYREIALTC